MAGDVLHTGNVLGSSGPTGISAEFRDELRINLYCARESFAPAAALGWFGPAGPRPWKETDPALGAAFFLPCSKTLNSIGASRKSSPSCYGRIKNSPKPQSCTLAANGSNVWLPVGFQLLSLTIPQPLPAKKLQLVPSLMQQKSQTWK